MLYMGIRQNILIIAVQNSPQHLTVNLVLFVDLRVLIVYAEQFDHMKPSLRFIKGKCEYFQAVVVMLCRKNWQVPVEDFDDKFGDVGRLSFFLLWLLDQQWKHSIERFYELPGTYDYLLEFARTGWTALLRLRDERTTLGLGLWGRPWRLDWLFRHHSQYLLMMQIISTLVQQQKKTSKAPTNKIQRPFSLPNSTLLFLKHIANLQMVDAYFLPFDAHSFTTYTKLNFIQFLLSQLMQILSINFIQQDRLMQKDVVNHRLNLSFEDFINMGESLSFTTVGKYAIYDFLAEGGFGKVYKGKNQATNQEVAVKVLNIAKIHTIASERVKQITLRLVKSEDILMRVCNSPHLVKCYDVYQNQSLKLMMIEYCNGGTLQDYIDKKGRIPQKEAILIFKQILNGIAECHSHKIIHRDLKSENVLMHNGIFKISDFGFSKQGDEGVTVLGTITNMAPEVMARKPYGLKADIWSAGIILFQMVFGMFPYESTDKKALFNEITGSQILKSQRIKFNNYTASSEMSTFIRQILVIEQQKRIGWRELLIHPIFKQKNEEKIPRSQITNFDLIVPQIMDTSLSLGENISYIMKNLKVNVVFQDSQKVIKRNGPREHKVMSEQTQIYIWMNENLVQCLKIQLIYEQIISKLQSYKMLDFDQRECVELMYLLVTRCFLNISPINDQMSKLKDKNVFIKQTQTIIKTLYQKIHTLFDKYAKFLTQEEDKFLNKISDFFKSKKQLEKTDKFLNGIQNYDFKKDEQLNFIQKKYIDELKKQIKGPQEVKQKVRKYLANYTNINMIQFKHLQSIDFDTYIQKLL